MITLLVIYLLFQLIYDHWAQDNSLWWAIYYSFQYGWVGAIAMYHFGTTRKLVYMMLSLPFVGLALDEWVGYWMNLQPQEMASIPVLNLTIFVSALFIIYEIIQWRKRLSGSRGRI